MTTFIIENKTKIKEGLLQPMTNVELWFSTLVSIFLGSFYEISWTICMQTIWFIWDEEGFPCTHTLTHKHT